MNNVNQKDGIFSASDVMQEASFTMRDFVRLLFKHKIVILCTFIVVTALVIAGLFYLPPTYISEGKVLVKIEQQAYPSFFSGIAAYREPRDTDPVNRKIETEMSIVYTRELSERVVEALDLRYGQIYHKPLAHLVRPVADAYDWIKVNIFGQPIDPEKYGFKATVKAFNDSFTVEPIRSKGADVTSNLFSVTIKAADPEVAQKALQKLLQEYVRYALDENQRVGINARELVAKNVNGALRDLIEAEEDLKKFLGNQGIHLVTTQDLPPTNVGQTVSTNVFDAVPIDGGQQAVTGLKDSYLKLEMQLMSMRQEYTDQSENVKVLRKTMADLEKRIKREVQANAKAKLTQMSLQRNARNAEQRYIDLQRKLDQIDLFLQINESGSDIRTIAETPLFPKSSEWRRSFIVAVLGSLAGLLLGLAFAGYQESSDHRLDGPEDVERHLGLIALTTISMMDAQSLKAVSEPISR